MSARKAITGSLIASLVGGVACAAPTFDDQMVVMNAQLELLRKQQEIRQARAALAGSQSLGLPTVLSVTVGTRSVARLQLANGIASYYRVGDQVAAGMVVASITPRLVTVAVGQGKGSTEVPLEFEAPLRTTPVRPASEQAPVPPQLLPPLPPIPYPSELPVPAAVQRAKGPAPRVPAIAPAAASAAVPTPAPQAAAVVPPPAMVAAPTLNK